MRSILVLLALSMLFNSCMLLGLTRESLRKALKSHKLLVVEFFEPSCRHCQTFEAVFSQVRGLVDSSHKGEVAFGRFSCSGNYQLCHERYSIAGFPSVLFFYQGEYVAYKGQPKAEDLLRWIEDRLLHSFEEYPSEQDVEDLVDTEQDVFVFYSTDNKSYKTELMRKFAFTNQHAHFFVTSNPVVAGTHGMTGDVDDLVFIKKHFEGVSQTLLSREIRGQEWDQVNLAHFYAVHQNPSVHEFSEELVGKLERAKQSTIILFTSDREHSASKSFDEAALKFRVGLIDRQGASGAGVLTIRHISRKGLVILRVRDPGHGCRE